MRIPGWIKVTVLFIFMLAIGGAGGYVYSLFSDLPDISKLESYAPLESSIVYSSDGKILAEFYLERRTYIPHYKIPLKVKQAFVAIEDQRFYSHHGVDFLGILRAVYKDIMAKGVVEGGSTITQQLTKMLFFKPEKSVKRKIKEAIISAQIEKRYTKDEILGMYLNQAYFGTRAYGIDAAARTYFGKPVDELSIGEIAMIAGLQKAPSSYSPFRKPEKALMRRSLVLKSMLDNGFITKEECERGKAEPIPAKPFFRKFEAPYFVESLRQHLEEKYSDLYTAGLRINATIDFSMQKTAEEAVSDGIRSLEQRVKPGVQAALIAIDIRNGHIKALVGGTDFWETQFNRVTMAVRQPGSAFKPFVYATALEKGMTADSNILDGPVSFPGATAGHAWSPKNYDGKYHGIVPLKTAIALSLNAATVRLANQVGIKEVVGVAEKCGIKSEISPYLSTALGAADVTPLEITAAYMTFATGKRIDPVYYEKVLSRDGFVLEEEEPASADVFSDDTVAQMKDLLRGVVERGTAIKAKEIQRMVYGKTGTTNDFSDAWFIGFDDSLVVGVWVGRDNHVPIGNKETGARAALPIWMEFMQKIDKYSGYK
ncbi:MAG TPA: PBP1A family penicillin-binding protein [Dissulfurispiraceae bacterium]|nr:PBP1A family penicillin-binding protein [Dissulfurispiraceae bacterium]